MQNERKVRKAKGEALRYYKELEGCTFRPKLAAESKTRRLIKEMERKERSSAKKKSRLDRSIHDRLYDNATEKSLHLLELR